jgi:hypothetical protein
MRRRLFLLVVAIALVTLWPGAASATTASSNHAPYLFWIGINGLETPDGGNGAQREYGDPDWFG